jgi:acetylornithine/N-succinyldiaminopimelate aminotransferase
VNATGKLLQQGLRDLGARTGVFDAVRGRGLLVGAQVSADAGFTAMEIVHRCRALGMLVHVAGPDVVRFAPPLVLTEAHVQEGLEVMSRALTSA